MGFNVVFIPLVCHFWSISDELGWLSSYARPIFRSWSAVMFSYVRGIGIVLVGQAVSSVAHCAVSSLLLTHTT